MDRFYLIWSLEHDAWWRPARRGYTREVHEAGIYADEDAAAIVRDANVVALEEVRIPIACVGIALES